MLNFFLPPCIIELQSNGLNERQPDCLLLVGNGLEVVVRCLKQDFSFSDFIEIDYEDEDIECNLPLLDGAQLSATSSLNERGPENARLNGE